MIKLEDINFLHKSFLKMIEKEKIDISILDPIKNLRNSLRKANSELLEGDILQIFPLFHSLEIEAKIMDALIDRIPLAYQNHDNPKIAEDFISIFPDLSLLHHTLTKIPDSIDDLITLSNTLQSTAMKHNLFPPKEKIINKERVENLKNFIAGVGEDVGRQIEAI